MPRRTLVVIPAYNEAETIEAVASGAARHADVCVVDDASTDGTGDMAAAIERVHVVRHARNTHIAGGILDGFRYAREQGYEACITMDAGLSHDPEAIPAFLAEEADLVIGYRAARENVPFYRRALSDGASVLMNMALDRKPFPGAGPGLRDCTSGYRLYSRRAFELLLDAPLRSRAFDFHIEALAWVYRAGFELAEVPITYRFTNSSLQAGIVWEALRTWTTLWTHQLRLAEGRPPASA